MKYYKPAMKCLSITNIKTGLMTSDWKTMWKKTSIKTADIIRKIGCSETFKQKKWLDHLKKKNKKTKKW